MNESVPVRRGAILTLLLALLLGACGQAAPAEDPPLAGARLGGAFSMTDQNGNRVTERSWPGKYQLVYFGYTFCPDVCPVDMRVLGAGLRRFEESDPARGAKVQPLFVSVDPARDTPVTPSRAGARPARVMTSFQTRAVSPPSPKHRAQRARKPRRSPLCGVAVSNTT